MTDLPKKFVTFITMIIFWDTYCNGCMWVLGWGAWGSSLWGQACVIVVIGGMVLGVGVKFWSRCSLHIDKGC